MIDLLEPILDQINPKAFKQNYDKLLSEVSEIYNVEFELLFNHEFKNDKAKLNKNNIN